MAKNILFLKELEDALQYWSDVNLFAEALFETYISKKGIPPDNYNKPLAGSELDKENFLARPVKNWRGFKHGIQSNLEMDPLDFLPHVPTVKREKYTQLDYMRSMENKTIAWFPYFLSKWLKYKKVFSIDNLSLIKPVSIEEKNYLSFLPYGSFVIKFNDPLQISTSGKTEVNHTCAIVTLEEEDDIIDVLFLHDDIKERGMNDKERNTLLKGNSKKYFGRLDFIPESSLFGMSIAVEHGKAVADMSFEFENDSKCSILNLFNNFKMPNGNWGDPIIALLNGFCKVISELPKTVIVENKVKEESITTTSKYDDYGWNAVPITKVIDLGNIESIRAYLSNVGSGGEKSPHWRRGHWRNIPLKSGAFRRKWIPQTFVREDKLETENLKGSAMILKKRDV